MTCAKLIAISVGAGLAVGMLLERLLAWAQRKCERYGQ